VTAAGRARERLIIAPGERRDAVVGFIDSARERLDLSLFRCDDESVLDAIGGAARRGVRVRALMTEKARGSKKHLKDLRKKVKQLGVEVRRYADPVVRYHAKYAVADGSGSMVASLNFTRKCFRDTCDFMLLSGDAHLAGELARLFDADWEGHPYAPGKAADRLIVGPDQARSRFASLIQQATRTIRLIDPKIGDSAMLMLLRSRELDGVAVDLRCDEGLGTLLPHGKLLMVDDALAVTGSIALSTLALEFRRELAVVIRDRESLERLNTFWRSLPAWRSRATSRSFLNQEPAS
jgi:phosphatidylserine/phosphatidylglycerophosphate/cardiolipin synthase-like enzyme